MTYLTTRRAVAVLTIAAAAMSTAGCSPSGGTKEAAAAPKDSVKADATEKVTVGDMYVHPSASTVKAGTVDFAVTNDGKATHEVVVLKTDAEPASLKVTNGRISESTSVGEVGDIEAGATKHNVIKLEPGKYVLVCNIEGHYMAGMYAPLTVT